MIDLTASVDRYFSDSARLITETLPQLAGPTFSSSQDSRLSDLLRSDDIEIAVPECSQAQIQELHLLGG